MGSPSRPRDRGGALTGPQLRARPFLAAGELPAAGVTVIEASAGTGKTFTLTSLVLRFVADGVPLSALLAVTFTRMASGELRDRVRSRLAEAHRVLTAGPTGSRPTAPTGGQDEVIDLLCTGEAEVVAERAARLGGALADFDAATIATTHGFCQLVLHGLGTAGDAIPGTTLLEDPAELIQEVVDDLYLRRSLRYPEQELPFTLAQARQAALEATRNPGTRLVPAAGDDPCGLLRRLAEAASREIGRRLMEESLLTYDHLLFRLAGTLADPDRGPEACRRLADRFRVVLVDEFQDTDPVQWTVLERAFTRGDTRLVLIGDPKQAVYGFRGADVHAYLAAARTAGGLLTLDTNWRADQALLDATSALFDPTQFGHADIAFRSVRAPANRGGIGMRRRGVDEPPVRWRLVDDRQAGVAVTSRGMLSKPPLVEWVAADVASDVARALTDGVELLERGEWRRLREQDVAVLTRTNAQALLVRDALRRLGVASVVGGLDSVLGSEGAQAWLRLLEGLQEPSSRSRAAAVALGPFIAMTRAELASASDPVWESVHDRLHRWAEIMGQGGVAALYRAVTVEEDLPGRLVAGVGGERLLTDLGHVAQLLHAEASQRQLGAAALRGWLAPRIRSVADEQAGSEDRSRRLDSDAEAVQVLTVHAAKGLEFGLVYCPYMWDAGPPERSTPPVVFHDPEAGDRRTLDVGGPVAAGPAKASYQAHAVLARSERRDEDLRLLYVALTRARHGLVAWWARTQDCRHSPVGRLLLARDGRSGRVGNVGSEPAGRQVRAALEAVAARAPGLISIEGAGGTAAGGLPPMARGRGVQPPLSIARFTRDLDLRWRRSSYSSVTESAHTLSAAIRRADRPAPAPTEPEHGGVADEPEPDPDPGRATPAEPSPRSAGSGSWGSPLAGLPAGPAVGTFVHRVLERADFAAGDLRAELAAAVADCARRGGAPPDPAVLIDGLQAALSTPLGPGAGGAPLAGTERGDRIDELGFELPLAGGDRPRGQVRPADIGAVLRRHLGPGDRLSGYADRLDDPLLDTALRGYLTGSLDLVFRRAAPVGPPRWYVVDYKTNWLGREAGDLLVGDYRPALLDAEMQRCHYPLQALIYVVALHRYLRWRLGDYRPETHLGGVAYLFVRGMAGPLTPTEEGIPYGVWSWAVPPQLVTSLSDLFDAGQSLR